MTIASEAREYFKGQMKFETSGRSVSLAESIHHTIVINGRYQDLLDMKLETGAKVPSFCDQQTIVSGDLYVLNFSITKNEDGDMGSASITAVEAKDIHKPYHQTVDVDISEVSKRLINHPNMKGDATQFQIRMFEATEENLRFSSDGKPQSCFSLTTGKALVKPVALTDENAILYAQAQLIGVDSYNVYLPVVTRVSQYLKLPTVSSSPGANEISGTISPVGLDKLGEYDDDSVPVTIEGYTKGRWFKGTDKFQQNANGSWTRTESWVYTNDLRLEWIYKNGAAKEIVIKGSSGGAKK